MQRQLLALVCVSTFTASVAAQYYDDFESYTASGTGTIITGQGTPAYYVPVAGSLDGMAATYAGNAWGVPPNPNGGSNFYVGISQATNVFARAQKTINVPTGGRVYIQYDICVNYVGVATPTNNIGSFSFQPSGTSVHVNTLPRWPTGTTNPPAAWNADVVVGTAQGPIGDPAFLGLTVNNWYTWGVTADLANGVYVDFRIRDLQNNGPWTVFVPAAPMALPNAGFAHPTDFRFFTGGSDNLFATDNLIIDFGASYDGYGAGCAGSLGVPTLAAAAGSAPAVGSTFQADIRGAPLGVAVIASGFSNTTALGGAIALPFSLAGQGFPGCNLLADPAIAQFLTGAGTTVSWTFAIPNISAFVGTTYYQQGIVLDSAAPGAAFTNGAKLRIGY